MKISPKKLLIFSFVIFFIVIILFTYFTVFPPQKKSEFPEKNQQLPKLPIEQNNQKPYQIQRQNKTSYDFLKENPDIINLIKELVSEFDLTDIETSIPVAAAKLDTGKEIILLSGCESSNCGNTGVVIAYDQETNKIYLLTENVPTNEEYEIFGNPPENIRDLLIYFYLNE